MNLLLRGKQNAGSLPGRNTSTSSKGSQKAHQSSWWSLLALHMRQMQSEQSLCHARKQKWSTRLAAAGAHVGPRSWPWGLQEATSSSSILRGIHQNTSMMPFLPFQWGGQKESDKAEPDASWHSPLAATQLRESSLSWARQVMHPISSPGPSGCGGQHLFAHCSCTHQCKGNGVSWIVMHAALFLSGRFYFSPWKAPEDPQMGKGTWKVRLFSCSSQSRATLQINALRQWFKKSLAERSPSLSLSHRD